MKLYALILVSYFSVEYMLQQEPFGDFLTLNHTLSVQFRSGQVRITQGLAYMISKEVLYFANSVPAWRPLKRQTVFKASEKQTFSRSFYKLN